MRRRDLNFCVGRDEHHDSVYYYLSSILTYYDRSPRISTININSTSIDIVLTFEI